MAAEGYDVLVIGSGAAGGMAAYALTKSGAKVCVLEAGRDYDPIAETPMFQLNHQAPLRAARTPDKPFGYYDATVDGGWEIPDEPYSSGKDTDFRWFRARMLGGRTNHWGRVSLRFAEHDMQAHSIDGLGADWPLSYQELSPYYDKAETLMGITGNRNGLEDAPDSPPGVLHTPPPPRSHELLVVEGGRKLNRPVVASNMAVITRPIDGRSACIYATPCTYGCSIGANFQSTTVLFPPARKTGNLTVITDAMVYELSVNKRGVVEGVYYVDKRSGEHKFVSGKAVMLGASAMESIRILKNSKSTQFPDGIGADSGMLGHYIMDTVGSNVWGQFPQMESLGKFDDFGIWYPHIYVPWWGLKAQRKGKLDFARGFHIEVSGGRREPEARTFDKLWQVIKGSYGQQLKQDARRYFGSFVRFAQRGESLPFASNRAEVVDELKDRWGIPTLKFHYQWSDQELKQTRFAQLSMAELIEASGGNVISAIESNPREAISTPGSIIHEAGGVRSGSASNNSVVDSYGRVWGVPNLYVVDGSVFPSMPHKNPTLTIVAFAWRASDHLLQEMSYGNL